MNTVTLKADAYKGVQRYAQQMNKSVDEVVNNIILTYIVPQSMPQPAEEKRDYYTLEELRGMFRSGKSDEELRNDYLADKYNL